MVDPIQEFIRRAFRIGSLALFFLLFSGFVIFMFVMMAGYEPRPIARAVTSPALDSPPAVTSPSVPNSGLGDIVSSDSQLREEIREFVTFPCAEIFVEVATGNATPPDEQLLDAIEDEKWVDVTSIMRRVRDIPNAARQPIYRQAWNLCISYGAEALELVR